MIELEGNLDNRMRPAYSTAKTTINAAACSNHPAIDGCEPLVSSATRNRVCADKPHYVKSTMW
jgi:hypothetical protein